MVRGTVNPIKVRHRAAQDSRGYAKPSQNEAVAPRGSPTAAVVYSACHGRRPEVQAKTESHRRV